MDYIEKPTGRKIRMFTFLAIAFIILLLVAIYYGYGIVIRKPPSSNELNTETCSLCRRRVERKLLVERQVGDSRLFYFCPDCIQGLHAEVQRSATSSS
jgi:hypothetical protein